MKNIFTLLFAFGAVSFPLQAQTNSSAASNQSTSLSNGNVVSQISVNPQTPTLYSPLDMSIGIPTSSCTLVWNTALNAISYEIHVARDTAFTVGLFTTQTGSLVAFTPALMPLTTYYWRVRAIDQLSAVSGWSTVWQFTTDNAIGFAEYNSVELSLYPVPCNDKLLVVSEEPLNRITLTDLQGRIVRDVALNNESRVELETAGLPTGMYILHAGNRVRKVEVVR
jgi:hypothetical protein